MNYPVGCVRGCSKDFVISPINGKHKKIVVQILNYRHPYCNKGDITKLKKKTQKADCKAALF